jgi:hypothetical protein
MLTEIEVKRSRRTDLVQQTNMDLTPFRVDRSYSDANIIYRIEGLRFWSIEQDWDLQEPDKNLFVLKFATAQFSFH